MIKISAAITTFNNEDTLEKCLSSLSFCDEIIIVDSNSIDETLNIAKSYGCKVFNHNFLGYSKQKQLAIDYTNNDWVLLLDSDESIDQHCIEKFSEWQNQEPSAKSYSLPRREWVFWQWSHKWVHKNRFIRLFDKNHNKMNHHLVHESVQTDGNIENLDVIINHYSDRSIREKVDKINKYSSLAAQQKFDSGKRVSIFKILFLLPFYFFKQLILRRQIFNGTAGLINASLNSYYALLKYTKLYELQKNKN